MDASDAQQLTAVAATAVQRDFVSVARLTLAATSLAVREAGCRALVNFLAADYCHLTLEGAQLIVDALVSALHAQPTSAVVQREACRGLAFLGCFSSAEVCALAGQRGAIEAAVTALRHAENDNVLVSACSALSNLLLHSENCGRAHRAGALNALLDVMCAHPTHLCVQISGCVGLEQMCENIEGLPEAAVQLGAPAVIISALRTFPDSSALQANACRALAAVLPAEPTADDDAQHAGAVSCVVHALRTHPADASVQSGASFALMRRMMHQPVNAAEALQLGAFPLLLKSLQVHSMRADVLRHCFNAASFLVEGVRSAGMLPKSEAEAVMRASLTAMRTHPACAEVQGAACGLLSELSVGKPQLAAAAAEAGAIEAVVHALHAFTNSDVGVCSAACLALGNLACSDSPTSSQRAVAAGAVAAVVTVLTTYPDNAAAQDEAAHALCCL